MAALNAKISSALSTSFADLEVRDAFHTLDSRSVQNTPETRRNLRLDVQKEIIDCNAEVINDFGQVSEQLKRTGDALANLQKTCATLRRNLNAARIESAPMLDEARSLTKLTQQVASKQQILADFNAHFLLSDAQLTALTSTAEPVGDAFFAALVKAKQIHKDSEVLLGTENQRLGLEILDTTTKHLNAAFQKLFRWAQREFKTLDLEDGQLSSTIRRALRVLAERPTLFQECLDTFAETRDRALADAFYVALTGTPADRETQKPIEFSAHEPLRYVGDMLAWAHSTAVSERESLEVLFIAEGSEIAKSIESGLESEPWSRREGGEVFNGKKALSQLVSRNLAGVAQLLRQRIDTVIHTHNEPVLEYKIANLVMFYRTIFAKLLEGEDFMQVLDTIEDTALTQFRAAMRIKITNTDQEEDAAPDDLEPPEFLEDALEELAALLKSYDTSASLSDPDGGALTLLLADALDPWLSLCEKLSATLEAPRDQCFMINCLLAARTPVQQFAFARPRVKLINEDVDHRKLALTETQHELFLDRSGIKRLLDALESLPVAHEQPQAILSHGAFSEDALLRVREQLDAFLPSALMDSVSDMKGLQSSALSHEISGEAADRFCNDFTRVEEAIIAAEDFQLSQRKDDDETPTVREIFPRTAEETRILLS